MAIMDYAAMSHLNTSFSVNIPFQSGVYVGVELLACMITLCVFENIKIFSKAAITHYIPLIL